MTDALQLQGLSVAWRGREVLHGIDLQIAPGEILGLVGESGSGKSTLAYATLRYLPGGEITAGRVMVGGVDVRALDATGLRALRGRQASMVFQDPSAALNPTLRLGEQLAESLRRAEGGRTDAHALLRQVGLPDPARLLPRFPHQVSGGEKQRLMIAMALATRPALLLCDEPTTALDTTTASGIVDQLRELRDQTGLAILFISHDLGTTARLADRVAVLQAGRLVESGPRTTVLAKPEHPYTRALLDATPDPTRIRHKAPPVGEDVLRVSGLEVRHRGFGFFRRAKPAPAAVDDVSLTLRRGETLGLVGESGCGKSSLARALAGLGRATGATVDGRIVRSGRVELIFQHPDASLNPRRRVGDLIGRPLVRAGLSGGTLQRAVAGWLERVRLPASYGARFSHSLSGGEKQRVAIARAFAARPAVVICDEITSSLDVSIQAQVLDLLRELQRDEGTGLLFISHDLNVVRRIAHRLAVMYLGRIVEVRPMPDGSLDPPMHPYTEALMAASPVTTPGLVARQVRLATAEPGPVPSGCRLRLRCPRLLGPVCATVPPRRSPGPAHGIECHIPLTDLTAVPPIWSRSGEPPG